ncbi:hypothetical protein Acr_00g0020630 [Actinidia rufa]|uniref:Uncharacterized protein n=1 Tax=Actinidia rufa TaxID=165716 RepID=A0A7J0DDT8_9ERIC|nr:hypothetical protein Acr_00g0020630 [Actinidia rufa]
MDTNKNSYQDPMEEETEETLSFCDLPIYSDDSDQWENFSKEDQSLSSSSLSSSDQDLRVSILTSPVKPRWQDMMFGLARSPAREMELREMRSRQSRQSPPALFRLNSGDGQKVHRVEGLLGLIRSLGCGSHHHHDANSVVKA